MQPKPIICEGNWLFESLCVDKIASLAESSLHATFSMILNGHGDDENPVAVLDNDNPLHDDGEFSDNYDLHAFDR